MRKRQYFWSIAAVFACAFSCLAASTVTVEPGDVVALTNYLNTLSGGSTIILKPGIYDLSQVHGTTSGWGYYHLYSNQKHIIIKGENTKHWSEKTPEEETILRGDGTATIFYAHGAGGRNSSLWHITFENGYRPATAPDGTGINSFGGGALSWAQTESCNPAQGKGLASNCVFRSCSSAYHGGATHGVDAFDCFYTNNTCEKAGGAARGFVGTNGGAINHTNIFKNCVFIDNKALGGAGGAIYGEKIDSLTGCTFIGNTATQNGGAVYCTTPVSSIARCTFVDNATPEYGGAITFANTVDSITDCAFTNNTAAKRGGAILCDTRAGTISGCVFKGNSSTTDRGGAMRLNRDVNCISNCTFIGNTAVYNGGGISNGGGPFLGIEDCIFTNNTTVGETDNSSGGGGISSLAVTTRVMRTTFVGNLSSRDGGGALIYHGCIVSNCTFRENVARQYGGGLVSEENNSKSIVFDSLFDGNTNAWGNYGSQIRKVPQVIGCTFTGWGDMLAKSYDRCTFDGCKFDYCWYSDGMVQFDKTTGASHIRNCLFKECSVHTLIYNVSAKPLEIANCTFASNSLTTLSFVNGSSIVSNPYLIFAHRNGTDPDSGGAYPCTNTVVNCIFHDNRIDGTRVDANFYATAQGTIPGTVALNIVSNSIYGVVDASQNRGSAPVYANFTQVSDPRFVAGDPKLPGVPYYMVRRSSPAVNAGIGMDWMADAVDLAGTNRIVEARVDLGCYECWLPETGLTILFR
jgi:predicted outer membrane repeat protein